MFWWFAWSIMIGQLTSRFVGRIKTQHLLLALLITPSILALTILIKSQLLQIQWIGAIVVRIYISCIAYKLFTRHHDIMGICTSPPENKLDYSKIGTVH